MSDAEHEYRHALRRIASVGGDLSDIYLSSGRGGPNEAVHRGLLYIRARSIALQALHQRTVKFLDEVERYPDPPEHLYCVVAVGRLGGHAKATQIGDFNKTECYEFARRLNVARPYPYDGNYAVTYKVAQYHCLQVEDVDK